VAKSIRLTYKLDRRECASHPDYRIVQRLFTQPVRVEDGRGSLSLRQLLRVLSPLIEPDAPSSGIRLRLVSPQGPHRGIWGQAFEK
jgi:hypothetical protein